MDDVYVNISWSELVPIPRLVGSYGHSRVTGKPHLTLVSGAAAAVPASVLTAARKLKYSWILGRLPLLIQSAAPN